MNYEDTVDELVDNLPVFATDKDNRMLIMSQYCGVHPLIVSTEFDMLQFEGEEQTYVLLNDVVSWYEKEGSNLSDTMKRNLEMLLQIRASHQASEPRTVSGVFEIDLIPPVSPETGGEV